MDGSKRIGWEPSRRESGQILLLLIGKLGADDGKELRDVVVKETWVGGRRVFPLDDRPDQETWIKRVYGTVSDLVDLAMGWTKGASREDL